MPCLKVRQPNRGDIKVETRYACAPIKAEPPQRTAEMLELILKGYLCDGAFDKVQRAPRPISNSHVGDESLGSKAHERHDVISPLVTAFAGHGYCTFGERDVVTKAEQKCSEGNVQVKALPPAARDQPPSPQPARSRGHGLAVVASPGVVYVVGPDGARGGTDLAAVAGMLGHARLDIVRLCTHPTPPTANEHSISCHMTLISPDGAIAPI